MMRNKLSIFDEQSLTYKEISTFQLLTKSKTLLGIILLAFTLMSMLSIGLRDNSINVETMTEPELIMIYEKANNFSPEKLKKMLHDLNIRNADIVYAQAVIETGHFKSEVFHANNNLFGMKEAKQRITYNNGSHLGFATYKHWTESVLDYALYQSTYLNKLSREQYLQYLEQHYAPKQGYMSILRKILKQNEKTK